MRESISDFEKTLFVEKVIKNNEAGTILVVREEKTRYLYRSFSGSGEVYQSLMRQDHPHVPKIYGVHSAGNKVAVLEEYIQGDTLSTLLSFGALPAEYAVKVMRDLCEALESLHKENIVHRDIKPENIMIRGDEAVLIDFDAGRIEKEYVNADTCAMGTAGYAAPEQYGFAQTDCRADIYALGVLFNEMLTGYHPSKVLTDSLYRPVVERCIEVNVDKRYHSAPEVLRAIRTVQRKKERRWLRLGLPVCIGVLLLGFFIGYFAGRSNKDMAEAPQKKTETRLTVEASGEKKTEPEESSDVPEKTPIIREIPVAETPIYSMECPFSYDLDGDGTEEDYIFSMAVVWVETGCLKCHRVVRDGVIIGENERSGRQLVPCIWREGSEWDDEPVKDFIPLIQDAGIKLYRGKADMPAPKYSDMPCEWPGGMKIEYGIEHTGTWYYELHITIDGKTLVTYSQTDVNV